MGLSSNSSKSSLASSPSFANDLPSAGSLQGAIGASTGLPSSDSMILRARAPLKGGTWRGQKSSVELRNPLHVRLVLQCFQLFYVPPRSWRLHEESGPSPSRSRMSPPRVVSAEITSFDDGIDGQLWQLNFQPNPCCFVDYTEPLHSAPTSQAAPAQVFRLSEK